MPELAIFVASAILVGAAILLMRRKPHPAEPDDRPHPGVQNHEGDE